MTLAALSALFGWMTVIHLVFLVVAALSLLVMQGWAAKLHARMFGLEDRDVRLVFYKWLGAYKLLIFVTALVPWLALQLM